MITKEIIAENLKKVREELGKIPTKMEYVQYGNFGANTVIRRYGTWTNALTETFEDYVKPSKSILKKCSHCDKKIKVMPSMIKEQNYCSISCSNKHKPKRKKLPRPKCATCSNKVQNRRDKYCNKCHILKNCSFHLKTLGEIKEKRKDATRYSQIREHARKALKQSNCYKECFNCRYDKHVHTCHIKDICTFPDTATVEEVNSLDNLVYLCPNCHWEFDHNLLKL